MVDIVLENIDPEKDGDILFNYMTGDNLYLFSSRKRFNSKKLFFDWLYQSIGIVFHDFFCLKYDSTLIGYVYNYNFSLIHQHCKILVYVSQEYQSIGIGTIAAVKFINYLFEKYPLKKIYSTVFDYNYNSLISNLSAGFVEEGVLEEYKYHDGKYYSLHYLSISREQFTKLLNMFPNNLWGKI